MSKETMEWLDQNTLTGFIAEHGAPWHGGSRVWDGPVPLESVNDLFAWDAIIAPLTVTVPDLATATDVTVPVDGKVAVVRDDTLDVLGVFSESYKVHQYREWLVENVATVLDVSEGDLMIGSAGLLRRGGQAWVQIRPNDGIEIGGDRMVPWLLAATSHDGTIATQYRPAVTRVVCDNTLRASLSENAQNVWKNKHTSRSLGRVEDARIALEMLFTQTDAFAADVERMINTTVTDDQFRQIVERLDPTVSDDASKRATTNQDERRATLANLWENDRRVGKFAGTAWGVLQAFNTQSHWGGTPATRTAERQMSRTIGGDVDKADALVLDAIGAVLATV